MMQSPMSDDRAGVLLFNLGGPETLEDVRPFLYNLFSDPEIIRIKSTILRKLLAWTISWTRQGKSRQLYRRRIAASQNYRGSGRGAEGSFAFERYRCPGLCWNALLETND
jgi:Ferrochelatase